MNPRKAFATASVTALALLAAGCGGAPTATDAASTAASTDAGCSSDVILAAVKNEADVKGISEFKCSGDWAYAGVITSGPDGIEYTAVLQRDGDGWKSVDREGPCKDHSVPADIYQAACETN